MLLGDLHGTLDRRLGRDVPAPQEAVGPGQDGPDLLEEVERRRGAGRTEAGAGPGLGSPVMLDCGPMGPMTAGTGCGEAMG